MELLKTIANIKSLIWIPVIELVLHSATYLYGSDVAKWHILGWAICFIIILSARLYFNNKFY